MNSNNNIFNEEKQKKVTFKKDEGKNPVADKRLSFLFDDD